MNISGSQDLLSFFDFHNTGDREKPYWALFESKAEAANGKGKHFAASSRLDSLSEETARKDLKTAISYLTHGTKLYVRLREKPDKSEHEAIAYYTHSDGNPMGHVGIGSVNAADVDKRVQDAVTKALSDKDKEIAWQKQIDDLKAIIKERKDDDFVQRLSGILDHPVIKGVLIPAIGNMVANKIKPKEMIGNVHVVPSDQNVTQEDRAKLERMENALGDICEVDQDFFEVLEKFANIAKSDPEKYDRYRNMLKMM
jgi:hypothetical protein